ncbi:MAG: IS66 family insertion sequence element accessory protein TnpB [Syntrophorhabdales bacterium]|jgi:transposase
MIQITPQMRILVAVESVDFRKGIDGLAGVIKVLDLDPFSGYLFVFRSRSGTSLKLLVYDSQGFWLCQKRLSKGTFRFWPKAGEVLHPLAAYELQALLWNKDPGRAPLWKPLK